MAASALSLLVALWAPVERSDGLAVGLEGAERIVSLGPSLTEPLVALGAGPKLVGTSDYCIAHADLENTRRVGTGLTPNYEAIVGLGPDLIVMERGQQSGGSHLEPLAPTQVLPGLSLEDVRAGVETLGALTQNQELTAVVNGEPITVSSEQLTKIRQ